MTKERVDFYLKDLDQTRATCSLYDQNKIKNQSSAEGSYLAGKVVTEINKVLEDKELTDKECTLVLTRFNNLKFEFTGEKVVTEERMAELVRKRFRQEEERVLGVGPYNPQTFSRLIYFF